MPAAAFARPAVLLVATGLLALLAFQSLAPAAATTGKPATRIVYVQGRALLAVAPADSQPRLLDRLPAGVADIAAARDGRRFALMTNRPGQLGERGSTRSVYLLALGRGIRPVLTFRSTGPVSVAISPDGSTLAFSRAGEIWTARAEGTRRRRLTSGRYAAGHPAFSPDGRQLVFVRSTTRGEGVFRVAVGGGAPTLLARAEAREPVVSSRGLIAFREARRGSENEDLVILAPNGSWRRRVAGYHDPFSDGGPSFSPDGRRLAYLSGGESAPGRGFSIRIVGLRDGARRVVRGGISPVPLGPLWVPAAL